MVPELHCIKEVDDCRACSRISNTKPKKSITSISVNERDHMHVYTVGLSFKKKRAYIIIIILKSLLLYLF